LQWEVRFFDEFKSEFRELSFDAKVGLGGVLDLLRQFGPSLGRPFVDTLNGSAYANMKEIRVDTEDNWYRFAFAFDPGRNAIILCGGGKGGGSQKAFYKALIETADRRYRVHLEDVSSDEQNN
jgi:hypothetical protein